MNLLKYLRSNGRPVPGACALMACGLLLVSASAQADYVFTTVDYPGATFTDVRGLNNDGAIVGYANAGGSNFGFLYSGGTFSPLPPAPGGLVAIAHGINDSGAIIGSMGPADNSYATGFVLSAGVYSFFTYPSRTHTYARSINAAGVITGYAEDVDAMGVSSNNVGFIYTPATGTFTDIVIPGSFFTIAQGINSAGQVVGSAVVAGGAQAFLRDPGTGALSYFRIDGLATRARGINDTGLITGFHTDASGVTSAFVGNSSGFQLLRANPSVDTIGEAINDSGQISGLFFDPAARGTTTHGFIATPAALPVGTTSGGAYIFSVDVVPNTPIFIDPPASLGYAYRIGIGNPRFTSVRLPIGIGDSRYVLIVNGRQHPLSGGELFDFRAHGYPSGVSKFRVTDIEASAGLDPQNPQAFPTELTFSESGRFTGTMTPLCLNHRLPPQLDPRVQRLLLRPCRQ